MDACLYGNCGLIAQLSPLFPFLLGSSTTLGVVPFLMRVSQVASMVKNPPANVGDTRGKDLIPGLGRSPGGGNGNPLQYSCLENSVDRGAWQATVFGVTKSMGLQSQM